MGASRLPTLRLTTVIHSSRCLEAFHCWSAVSGWGTNCNVGKRAPLVNIFLLQHWCCYIWKKLTNHSRM